MPDVFGTIPAMVTPFTVGGKEVALDWIPQHVEFVRRHGADGVLALGTNGEAPSLAMAEKRAVIDTFAAVRQGLAFLVGTGCAALPETIALSRYAFERGADAVLIVPPYYFKALSPRGLFDYYSAVFAALPAEGRIMLYNIPDTSGVAIEDELVAALQATYPRQLFGIKDTSGVLARTQSYIANFPQLAIFGGSDTLAGPSYAAGARGVISAVANALPDFLAAVRRAHLDGGDIEAAHQRLSRARNLLRRYPQRGAVKALTHIVSGLPLTWVRPPLIDLTAAQQAELRHELAAIRQAS